ncbi:MAG: hypothetical protein QOH62_1364 [Solirubrobacteraceae bacterium]|nr:hypothetical protein [Solirubrobacteraceae bacterium]
MAKDSRSNESSATVAAVITYRFGPRDLLRVRFAASPLVEVFASYDALRKPDRHAVHAPWAQWARPRLEGMDLALIEALSPSRRGYQPDFVSPPPDRPRSTLARELDRVRATPRPRIARELGWAYPGGDLPDVLQPLLSRPAEGLEALAAQVLAYAARVLAPHWARVEAAVEAEFSQRGRRLAQEGASAAFSGIHQDVAFDDGMLRVDGRHDQEVDLNGRGLLLVPSVFVWPDVWSMTDAPWQPAIIYAPAGVAELWAPPSAEREDALERLLGRRRAGVLTGLATPVSTLDLAARLGASPAGVSAHLHALRAAGLVAGAREGRAVLYARTPAGDALLRAPGLR